jgi:hypothetical protein
MCQIMQVVKIEVMVLWDVMPYSMMVGNQHFRGPYCLHLQVEVSNYVLLMVSIMTQFD